MQQLLLYLLLLPVLATAQLKEFEVSEMERPDVAVVQANAQWPEDALLLVYSSLKDLNFRSSLGGIDKVTYNPKANRYEILFKPNKQMLFVYSNNFVEQKIETFNPNPKDVFYYKVEEKQQAVVNTKPGTLKIVTEPSGADIQLNGIPVSTKTPFEGELSAQTYSLSVSKNDYQKVDTLVTVRPGEKSTLSLRLSKDEGLFNVTSTPEGAQVFIDGKFKGTTPLQGSMEVGQYEVEVKLDGYTASKQNLRIDENGTNELSFTMRERSALPTEIGQAYAGGIVFYLDGNGGGLIAAPTDQSTAAEWGCYGTEISGAEGYAVGTGNQNTTDIEAGCTESGTAVDICANLTLNGYNDWFLPSRDELKLMYQNLYTQGLGSFQGNYYWSSTELNHKYAVPFDFIISGSASSHLGNKSNTFCVRAVRAF